MLSVTSGAGDVASAFGSAFDPDETLHFLPTEGIKRLTFLLILGTLRSSSADADVVLGEVHTKIISNEDEKNLRQNCGTAFATSALPI